MKYCKFCGAEIPDGGVCSCAESQNEAIRNESSTSNKSAVISVIAVIAVIIIVIGILGSLLGGGYKKPISNFIIGLEKCDVSTMAKAFPEETAEKLKRESTDEDLETLISLFELAYGKNIKISFDIEDKKTLDKSEIEKLENSTGLDIKKAYELSVEVEFEGNKKDNETTVDFTVAKIKGEGWKLLNDALSELTY